MLLLAYHPVGIGPTTWTDSCPEFFGLSLTPSRYILVNIGSYGSPIM